MIIYKAENTINNKVYIGQSIHNKLSKRRNEHLCLSKSSTRKNHYFQNAILKYGIENFNWEIVYKTDNLDDLNSKETFYILHYKSNDKNFGYNLDTGGTNKIVGESTRQLLRKINTGRKLSIETINKIKETKKINAKFLKDNPKWRDDLDDNKIIELRQSGLSLDKIAEEMQCSRRAIENHLTFLLGKESISKGYLIKLREDKTKLQLTMPKRKVSNEDLIELYNSGQTLVNIANNLNITESGLYRRLKKLNVIKRHKWKS